MDELEAYAAWFLTQSFSTLAPPHYGLTNYGHVVAVVLHRWKQFQTELLIVPPNMEAFPHEHSHPNVDSIEYHVAGNLFFTIEGKNQVPDEQVRTTKSNGSSGVNGTWSRIRDKQLHGATTDPRGAAFLSIQHWKNGVVPSSVGLDWEGESPSPEHAELQRVKKQGG